jgi:hypothetical protein
MGPNRGNLIQVPIRGHVYKSIMGVFRERVLESKVGVCVRGRHHMGSLFPPDPPPAFSRYHP